MQDVGGREKRQKTLADLQAVSLSTSTTNKFLAQLQQLIVNADLPLSLIDHPDLRALCAIVGIQPPSRCTLTVDVDIDIAFKKMEAALAECLRTAQRLLGCG